MIPIFSELAQRASVRQFPYFRKKVRPFEDVLPSRFGSTLAGYVRHLSFLFLFSLFEFSWVPFSFFIPMFLFVLRL